jgi:hypothetical protein
MHQDLQLAGLAEGTQKAYLRVIKQFAAYFKKSPDQISGRGKWCHSAKSTRERGMRLEL